jgi:hypothetical protein
MTNADTYSGGITFTEVNDKGWICAKCGRSLSPKQLECTYCNSGLFPPIPFVDPFIPWNDGTLYWEMPTVICKDRYNVGDSNVKEDPKSQG